MINVLHIRKISIDVIPNSIPFIELRIDLHIVDKTTDKTMQVISDYRRIYEKISDMQPIPLTTEADDGVIDSTEIMGLVSKATLSWVMLRFGGSIDSKGRLVI